jgi:hypothetical protein
LEPQILLTEIETRPGPGPVLNLEQPSSSAGHTAPRAVEDPEPVPLNTKNKKKKKMEDLTSKLASALAKPGDQDSPAQHGQSAPAKPNIPERLTEPGRDPTKSGRGGRQAQHSSAAGKAGGATVVPAKTGEEARQIQPASAGATVAPRNLTQAGKKRPAETPKHPR